MRTAVDGSRLLIVTGGLLLLDTIARVGAIRVALRHFEPLPPLRVRPTVPDPRAERFEVTTSDGMTLRGSLHRQRERPPRGLVLFCPELLSDHWSVMSYCRALKEADFDLIAFDFRNQGESDHLSGYEPSHWLTHYELEDVRAVLRYIDGREDLRHLPLGIFGVSRGGCAALAAAAESPHVRCVAAESAFSSWSVSEHFIGRWLSVLYPRIGRLIPDWHVRVTQWLMFQVSSLRRRCRYVHLERLVPRLHDRPLLLIAGGQDTYVPTDIPRRLARLAAHTDRSVWIVDAAKHNKVREVCPETFDRRLVAFFSQLAPERPAHLAEMSPPAAARRRKALTPDPAASLSPSIPRSRSSEAGETSEAERRHKPAFPTSL